MRIQTTHADKCGPARRMSQRRVVAVQQSELGRAQRQNGVPLRQQGAMKSDEKAPADGVIDVPEAGHDVRHPGREERSAETERSLDAWDRSRRRPTGGEEDHASTRETV